MKTELDIEACKQGDKNALGTLYRVYSNKLIGICRHYIHDENMAKDVLHDAFIIIFTSIKSLKDNSKLEGWMIAIVRNLALKCLHDTERTEIPLSCLDIEIPDEKSEARKAIELEALLSAIDALPKGSREVFKLSVLDSLSHKEIASLLGINPHSSSSQLFRAKKMLRTILVNYWMLFLLPVLIPLYVYFVTRDRQKGALRNQSMAVKAQKDKASFRTRRNIEPELTMPKRTNLAAPPRRLSLSSVRNTYKTDNKSSDIVNTEQTNLLPSADSLSRNMTVIPRVPDSLFHISPLPKNINAVPIELACHRKAPAKHYPWTFNFGYSSTSSGNSLSNLNYLSVIDYARGGAMAKIYSWADYLNYLDRNRSVMDSTENARLRQTAVNSILSADHPLGERAHHHRPQTYSFSLNKRLSPNWTFGTGLTYTRLKSEFESTFNNATLKKTQKIDYIGLPLRLTYSIWHKGRLNAYTTGGVTFELPVHSSFTRTFTITPDSSFTQKRSISPRPQWSVNLGVGVQYPVFKPLSIYIEPNLFYYFGNGSGIQTYRTEHPFMFSIPFGLRLTW